jgi:hypothetical protein
VRKELHGQGSYKGMPERLWLFHPEHFSGGICYQGHRIHFEDTMIQAKQLYLDKTDVSLMIQVRYSFSPHPLLEQE